jgi:hypothetical protein
MKIYFPNFVLERTKVKDNLKDLTKKLKDRKLTKLVVSPLVEKTAELEVETLVLPPKKKSKKFQKLACIQSTRNTCKNCRTRVKV